MKNKESFKWYYIYQNTCGPCRLMSPVIDTMIAIDCPNKIEKIEFTDAPQSLKRHGTPLLALYNQQTDEMRDFYSGPFWQSYFEFDRAYKDFLSISLSPIEFVAKITSSTEKQNLLDKYKK